MKYLILFLMLVAVCFSIQPVLRKDPCFENKFYAYIPADDTGEYWARYDISNPANQTYKDYLAIQMVWYGKPREGKVFYYGSSGLTNNGFAATELYECNYMQSLTSGHYLRAVIPDGHNLIQVMVFESVSNGGTFKIRWEGGYTDDLDLTSVDTGALGSNFHYITVAENATYANGVRYLEFYLDSTQAKNVRIGAIRSFNTGVTGDPTTALGGLAVGHDLITDMNGNGSAIGGFHEEYALISDTQIISDGANYEWAFTWTADGGGANLITGPGGHYGAALDAEYLYHSGEYADGPILVVDTVLGAGLLDDVTNPVNSLWTGDVISWYSDGYADWDGDAAEDATEPHISATYSITQTGFHTSVGVLFQGATDVAAAGCLQNQATIDEADVNYCRIPPDPTKLYLSGDDISNPGSAVVMNMKAGCEYTVSCNQGIRNLFYWGASEKWYCSTDPKAFPGGTDPTTDDFWGFGGIFQVRRVNSNGSESWLGISGGGTSSPSGGSGSPYGG